jgi:hypothetical protein
MSNGSVERGVEWVSTHFGGAMGVLKLSWRREVLKKFNTVEACLGVYGHLCHSIIIQLSFLSLSFHFHSNQTTSKSSHFLLTFYLLSFL